MSDGIVCALGVERMLTFDGRGGEVSEEAHGHLQNVSFLQLGVARIVFANQRKNQTFQMTETVVDTSSSSLLQQGFKSLEEMMETCYSAALLKRVKSETFPVTDSCVVSLSLTFLSSLACFLWATVDLAGRGWLASVLMLGLISFAACCCAFFF